MSTNEKKPKSILETELDIEMKPADARKYIQGAFDVALDMAKNNHDPHQKLGAIAAIDKLYTTIVMKDFSDEAVTRMARTQDKTVDEVRRLRKQRDKKAWDTDDEPGDTTSDSEE